MRIKILPILLITLISCSKGTTEKSLNPAKIIICDNSSFVANTSQYIIKTYGEVPQQSWFLLEYDDSHREVCRTQYAIEDILGKSITKDACKDATLCTICLRNIWPGGIIDYYAYWPKGLHAGTNTEWVFDGSFLRWSVDKIIWD